MAIRTMMMLQGIDMKGTLRYSQENGIANIVVSVPGLRESKQTYSVYIFYDENKYEKVGVLKAGELRATVTGKGALKAAGIVGDTAGGLFAMTGETDDFNWDKAKSIFYLKSRGGRQTQNCYAEEIDETVDKPQDIFEGIYPLTEDDGYTEEEQKPVLPDLINKNTYEDTASKNLPVEKEPFSNEILKDAVNKAENPDEEMPKAKDENPAPPMTEAFGNTQEEICAQCPIHAKKTLVYPFSKQYREFEWEKTEYPGLKGYWHYITGRLYVNGTLRKIAIGVPGDYALNPPSWLYGFDTYAFADDGEARGYWLLFEDA